MSDAISYKQQKRGFHGSCGHCAISDLGKSKFIGVIKTDIHSVMDSGVTGFEEVQAIDVDNSLKGSDF